MTLERAYSTLEIKSTSVVDGKRFFKGIASTPTTDLGGDIMEPHGAQFKLPLSFLWQHDSKQPAGWIHKATPTDKGIEVEGEVHNEKEPGKLKERLDETWQSLKAGLVRGLSIGFRGLQSEQIKEGGRRYKSWLWLELSAVTIPMNLEATITSIKSADAPFLPPNDDEPSGAKNLRVIPLGHVQAKSTVIPVVTLKRKQ